MNKRIRNKKVRDALIRAEIRMLHAGFYTELQARREACNLPSAVYRRRLRAAIRAMPEFPKVSMLDTFVTSVEALWIEQENRKRKANPGVDEHERL